MTNILRFSKRISALALLFLVLSLFPPSVIMAAGPLWDSYEVPSSRQKERLYDGADLLTDAEEESLLYTLDGLSEKWQSNIVVLTVDEHTGPIQAYADDYFDYNGFCSEFNESGVLFMLSMADRSWAISTSGSCQFAFTDYGQEYLVEEMLPYLREADYSGAFNKYAQIIDYFLDLYSQGTPYDRGYKPPKTGSDYGRYGLISIIIGLVTGLIPIFSMKSQLKTVKMKSGAAGYAPGGPNLSVKEDTFINKTITKTARPKESDSRSGSSGGSSLHTSSSGHSHGGSSGHF